MNYVRNVREEDFPTSWVYFDVIERVELAAEEIVEEHGGIEGWVRVHEYKTWWQIAAARSDQ